jgi:methyl-accepting chemotaxis protein
MAMPELQATVTPEDPLATDPKARRRVRNYLLDTHLQLRLASYLIGVATAISVGLGWLLWRAYRESTEVLELASPQVGEVVAQGDRLGIVKVAVALAVVLLCLLGAAVMVTHRIAGPAYAIRMTCRRVSEGDLTEPRPLRERDLLTDLGDEVAAMVRALRGREGRDRDAMAAAAALLRDPAAPVEQRLEAARTLEALAGEKERRLRS